jgi:hypothetical protein
MANLVSPGVKVSITDESAYGSAGAGTVPMLFIATGANKADPTGNGSIAEFTKPENSGKPVLVTSQRELTQNFGNVDFRQVSGSVVQGDETNEYGLLAAYSFLGQSSAAYVVRANVDLAALRPQSSAPKGAPEAGTNWLNPANSSFGIHQYGVAGWTLVSPTVEITTDGIPTSAVVNGDFLVVLTQGSSTSAAYFIGEGGSWVALDSAWATGTVSYAPHYSEPTGAVAGDVWVKTTKPGNGLTLSLSTYTEAAADFVSSSVEFVQATAPTGSATDTRQDGSAGVSSPILDGEVWVEVGDGVLTVHAWAAGSFANIASEISADEPTGDPEDGTLWFDPDINELAIFEVVTDSGEQKWQRVSVVNYGTAAPTGGSVGDYWIDTDAAGYPVIYRHDGTSWVQKDNTDQSTSNGVVFGDITSDNTSVGGLVAAADVLAGGPNPLVHPVGTTGINMCRSGGTVRVYNAGLTSDWKWRNHAGNQANGAGSFGAAAQRKVIVAAMQSSALASELREETLAFRLIAAPGYPEMFDEMVTLNTDRGDKAFVIVDSPMHVAPANIVNWVQGTDAVENGVDGLVGRSKYAAAYYPSVLTTDPTTGASVVAPASHTALYTYAYNDAVSYQWFSPAGLTRGVVQNASNVGYVNQEGDFVPVALTQGQRDAMYDNNLNPIARFPTEGIVVFGQKTLASIDSAMDRVNVSRLVAYLNERFEVIARPFLFEPNDTGTRANAKGAFDGFMASILSQRGVYDFAVVCDETNNTPERIDRNELWIDVAIEPTKGAEFIYIPVRILNTGELQ